MPTISVVIPALNDAEMLEQCLEALAVQTLQPDEIVVVDNASTDDTAEVAARYGCRVIFEPVRGIPSATARGLDEAKMEILARLDADSVPEPDWLERVHKHFDGHPEVAAVTGTGVFYGSKDWVHWAGEKFYLGGYFWFFTWLLGHPPIFGSNCAIRRSTWQRIEDTYLRHEPKIHDDLHLSFRIAPDMEVVYDENLKVAVSARPITSLRRISRGAWWGYTTSKASLAQENAFQRRRARKNFHEEVVR